MDTRVDATEGHSFAGPLVKVIVGSDSTVYWLHQNALRASSSFFSAALKKEWTTAETPLIKLPEEEPATFERYARYLYSGTIACKGTGIWTEYVTLAKMYALGEKLLDPDFKNAIMDAIRATVQDDQPTRYPDQGSEPIYPGLESVRIIYSGTPEGSLARKLLVDVYAMHANASFDYDGDESTAHSDFLLDLVKAMSARRWVGDE